MNCFMCLVLENKMVHNNRQGYSAAVYLERRPKKVHMVLKDI